MVRMVAIAESSRCHRRARTCLRAGSALCKRRQKPETRFHRNQQYSITALTDASGSIRERYAYTAYGEPTFASGSGTVLPSSAEDNRYTYTGREWDEVLGLYHYRARMYDASEGRFISRDPIGFKAGDPNLFRYVAGAPTVHVDPSGEIIPILVGVGVGGTIWWLATPPAHAPAPGDSTHYMDDDNNPEYILITVTTVVCWRVIVPVAAKCAKNVAIRCRKVIKRKWVKRQRCNALRAAKWAACDPIQATGGCGRPPNCRGLTGSECHHREMLWGACATAREAYQKRCFKKGDPRWAGHQQQVGDARAAARNCGTCARIHPDS